jgi:hypothetical protein
LSNYFYALYQKTPLEKDKKVLLDGMSKGIEGDFTSSTVFSS